ncbi:hypothetical protein Y032_0831g2577 [Ancylostoma ceylanicum]|uniref:Uncharacterized protein n=1 Tax=Ancylostoma ceylanicum TaxID=53326 RepID=A0A016WBV0_9BILA|nr:hypothetical protein Y032_0831g2577 [Ancylostoma ceylanicum]
MSLLLKRISIFENADHPAFLCESSSRRALSILIAWPSHAVSLQYQMEPEMQDMTKLLGIDFAPLNIPWERRLQTLGAIHFFMVSLLIPVVTMLLPIYMMSFSHVLLQF